jgi:hypothetical protein
MISAFMSAHCHSLIIMIRNQFHILGSGRLQNEDALDILMCLNVTCHSMFISEFQLIHVPQRMTYGQGLVFLNHNTHLYLML